MKEEKKIYCWKEEKKKLLKRGEKNCWKEEKKYTVEKRRKNILLNRGEKYTVNKRRKNILLKRGENVLLKRGETIFCRSINGQLKNQSSIMQEDYEESISLTLRTWSWRKSFKNARRKLETPSAPAMPCKTCKKNKHGETSGKTNDFKSKFECILEARESTRMRMEEPLPKYLEDHIAGKRYNSLQHYNMVHKLIRMPQAMKIPAAKALVDEEWEKLEKIPACDQTKVRSKKELIDEAKTKGAKVHFASLMDICHLKNAELETKHQKYKGRVVLPVDIVKDDSGSYAVFTEQGSSASLMTPAKVMDIISRLRGCEGQAADAVSAKTLVKMRDAPKFLKIPKSESPDIWFRLPRHKWPKSWSSMEDPVVPLERNLCGHPLAGLLKGKATWVRRRFQIVPWKRIILTSVCGWYQIGWKDTKH